jgi:hypothetical protein
VFKRNLRAGGEFHAVVKVSQDPRTRTCDAGGHSALGPVQRMLVRLAMILAVVLAGSAAAAGSALAGPGLHIVLHNETTGPNASSVSLVNQGGNDCWYDNDLGRSLDSNAVAPGKTIGLYTEKKAAFFSGCLGQGTRGIVLEVKDGGTWRIPAGESKDYRIYWAPTSSNPWGFEFLDSLPTWVPRGDGLGLLCWHTSTHTDGKSDTSATGYADIYVYNDYAHCNVMAPADVLRGAEAPPPLTDVAESGAADVGRGAPAVSRLGSGTSQATVAATTASPTVVDVLSMVGVACPWLAKNSQSFCKGLDIGNDNRWSIDNLTQNIREFHVTSTVGTKDTKASVGTAQVSIPATSPAGTVAVNKTLATSQTHSTATQNGVKVGLKFGFKQTAKVKLPLLGEGGAEFTQEVSSEYNWSKTETTSGTDTDTRQVSISVGAAPGYTTRLEVFTTSADANYLYDADLDFGRDDGYEPVSTPAPQALGQSPAARQPCLAYTVGSVKARNSLLYLDKQALDSGISPTEPNLTPEQRAFMTGVPSFTTSGTCPGFPGQFPAAAAFKGRGAGTYADLGYDAQGKPVQVFTGCVYQTPFGTDAETHAATLARSARLLSPLAPPAVTSEPCQSYTPTNGPVSHAIRATTSHSGLIVNDARDTHPREAIVAPAGSDDIAGPTDGGTIYTNNGALDIVHAGAAATRVIGGSGQNVIYGGARGADVLIGGHGMNYLYAGAGAGTDMIESAGSAEMFGGRGDNTFAGNDMNGVMLGGSGPNTMIATGDTSGVEMTAGPGENTYEIKGRGTPRILQLPGRADRTRVLSDHSYALPPYIQTGQAIGTAPVSLAGNQGTTQLIANDAGDTLIAGPDAETLRGGAGNDTIVFGDQNDDVASGGGGANRYEFTGSPQTFPQPPGLAASEGRSANTITDFNQRRGDRLILSATVFGQSIRHLAKRLPLIVSRDPEPRTDDPTLLFNTENGLLSFDTDGNGPAMPRVVVILEHQHDLRLGSIDFTG